MSDAVSEKNTRPLRLASSVLLLRDEPFRVLMVRRGAGLHYSSALVFPGGMVDPEDHLDEWRDYCIHDTVWSREARALRVAAVREIWEEVGVILADAPVGHGDDGAAFFDRVQAQSARLALDELVPFGHWITPEWAPRRFDTHFFLARFPEGADVRCDGGENVAFEWIEPGVALDRWAAGESGILFPTRMNLQRLAESRDSDGAIETARRRPPVTVIPEIHKRGGLTIVSIPASAGYGEAEEVLPSRPAA